VRAIVIQLHLHLRAHQYFACDLVVIKAALRAQLCAASVQSDAHGALAPAAQRTARLANLPRTASNGLHVLDHVLT